MQMHACHALIQEMIVQLNELNQLHKIDTYPFMRLQCLFSYASHS